MDEHGSWFPLCKCIQCPLPGFMFSFHDIDFSVYMVQTKLSTPGSWACSTHSKMAAIDAAPTCWWNSTKNRCLSNIMFCWRPVRERVISLVHLPAVMKLENWSAYSTSHSFTMYSVHPFVPFDSAYLIHPSIHSSILDLIPGSGWSLRGTGLSFANGTWKRPSMGDPA